MPNRLLDVSTPPALGGFCCSNSFEKTVYYAMSCFELVESQYIELVGLAKERVNLHFEGREIKAAPLCFAFLSYLTMPC